MQLLPILFRTKVVKAHKYLAFGQVSRDALIHCRPISGQLSRVLNSGGRARVCTFHRLVLDATVIKLIAGPEN